MAKTSKIFTLTMLTSLLLLAFANVGAIVSAQSQGTVVILETVGGSTSPAAGTYNYDDGSTQTFTATPDAAYVFNSWLVSTTAGSDSTTDNPISLPMTAGVTYTLQANFDPILPPPGVSGLPAQLSTAAMVVVLPSAGGTTTPKAGTYALADATAMMLTATAQSGYQFSHWTISGSSTNHGGSPVNLTPTDNPYNVNHGYGYTYYYQAVFTPTGTTPFPSPTVPEYSGIVVIVIAVALVAIALGTVALKRKK